MNLHHNTFKIYVRLYFGIKKIIFYLNNIVAKLHSFLLVNWQVRMANFTLLVTFLEDLETVRAVLK